MRRSPTEYGTFANLITGLDPEITRIARQLRGLILDVHPAAIEVVRPGDGAASYGVGPKKMSEAHTYIMPKAGYVNLGFYYGVTLADPAGLMQGTGKRLRHVKVYSVEEAARPALRQLVEAALLERRQALGRPEGD